MSTIDMVMQELNTMYPSIKPELEFQNDFQCLVAVILSAQCTDKRVNIVTKNVLCKSFPGCLDSDYIISVAASNEKDELATFSNYGESVDIATPGTDILSTIPGKPCFSIYPHSFPVLVLIVFLIS